MYEFLVTRGGYEQRVSFRADTEAAAREMAEEWVGDAGSVLECVGRMNTTY